MAPFVVINNHDSKTAWSFTLLHELTHLWIGKTGISAQTYDHAIEKYCNDVASNLLVSKKDIVKIYNDAGSDVTELLTSISSEMSIHNISGSLIAYRMYRDGHISVEVWTELRESLKDLWLAAKHKEKQHQSAGSSGNYYNTMRHKVGGALVGLVRRSIHDGVLTETKAGKVLGVSSCSVAQMIGG